MKIAVIPARGGSKRIPRKNIKLFCGKPMIAWSIEAAQASGLFDHIVVSTDDAEIAEVAKAHGAWGKMHGQTNGLTMRKRPSISWPFRISSE